MQSHLRVKIKSLQAEARIIRAEERKLIGWAPVKMGPDAIAEAHAQHLLKTGAGPGGDNYGMPKHLRRRRSGMIRWLRDHQADATTIASAEAEYQSLRRHRTIQVREEARAAQLAMAFLRGRPYRKVEATNHPSRPIPYSVVRSMVRLVERYSGRSWPIKPHISIAAWFEEGEANSRAAGLARALRGEGTGL